MQGPEHAAMKVLMMHRNDGRVGGAQIQMNRLRRGLLAEGVDAKILCRERHGDEAVLMPYRPWIEKPLGWMTRRAGLNDIHLLSSLRVSRLKEVEQADLIDIHCLHSGAFSYAALPQLTSGRPVVFTMHDMWPITGHCHANLECGRWMIGCGNCPHLDVEPAVKRDATAIEWKLKRRAYDRSSFTIVTPSLWLSERIEKSMLSGFPVHHIPHGVDPEVFRPLDKLSCRDLLGIPQGKTVLLCAIEHMEKPLKGGHLFLRALHALPTRIRENCVLLFFGRSKPAMFESIPLPVINLGHLDHDGLKAIAFSAADLVVNPTRAESFGLVALESMACGIPVVAFAVGGIPELVRPGITGRLAAPDDPGSLAAEIAAAMEDREGLAVMGRRCREIVLKEYTLAGQVRRYIDLYQTLIEERSKRQW